MAASRDSQISNSAADLLRQGAACNVLFLGSANTESLTGPEVGILLRNKFVDTC